ncbi:MAG TPA: hypothetical protein VF247_01840 [Candidatus Krumholzibacteria bacterium]
MSARLLAPAGLVIGGLLGLAGALVPSNSLRGLCWGLDGIALVIASAMLAVHHIRRGHEMVAAGFLVFLAGETLVFSGSAMGLAESAPLFAAGAGLWSASLVLISVPRLMPSWSRVTAVMAAALFAVVAVHLFLGDRLTPLSRPLPFFAYPFLVATLFGWAWAHARNAD